MSPISDTSTRMGIESSIEAWASNGGGLGVFLDMTAVAHTNTQWLWLHSQDLNKIKPESQDGGKPWMKDHWQLAAG